MIYIVIIREKYKGTYQVLVHIRPKGQQGHKINTLPQFYVIRQIVTVSINQIRQVLFLSLSVVSLDAKAFMSSQV